MVHVSCQQFILTVFCSLLIFQQCVRLTSCQHKRLLNGCLDILNIRLSFFFASRLSHRGGNYFLPRVFWTRTKLISVSHWACVFTRNLTSELMTHNTLHAPLTLGRMVSYKNNQITGDEFSWIASLGFRRISDVPVKPEYHTWYGEFLEMKKKKKQPSEGSG